RHLQGHRAAGLQIGGLEHRTHAAPGNDIGNLEPFVQDLSRLKLVHRLGYGRVVGDRPAIIPYPLHILDLEYLHRDVVRRSALFREVDQPLAGLDGRRAAHHLLKFAFRDTSMEAVRTLDDDVAVPQHRARVIDLDRRTFTDAPGEDAAQLTSHRLVLRYELHLH